MFTTKYGNLLHGDDRYNPRFTQEPEVRSFDGAITLTGWMVADSPQGITAWPPLPKLPLRVTIPANGNTNYQAINFEMWRRIQAGESLWGLDFAPIVALPSPLAT